MYNENIEKVKNKPDYINTSCGTPYLSENGYIQIPVTNFKDAKYNHPNPATGNTPEGDERNYTDLLLSGEYPTGVKFPQIYLKHGHNRNHVGGYTELKEYLKPSYDFEKLKHIAKQLTRNLNHIID